ncbi:hypothetical protein WR25_25412 [Diploscapter pachys]|uniref:Uncharacterized protein n=1 Tax=Diploscapter pachys TaxID=2018661 RepID=A0A2A2JGS9_9BILA|nr:hypothetical protein WR25_25412 [Diploscapter pachys]
MRLGLTRLFADSPWLTLLIVYLATTVQIQARDYSSARDLYEKRRRWENVEDILELAGLKKRNYHKRYGYHSGHSEIRRHPGSYGRKNWSNERQNYEIALLEAKADSVPSWSHAIDDKDTIYDIERDLAQWTPVDLAKESQEIVESATAPKDSEESDLQDLEKEMDEASWTLASTFATKAPVVLDYASVVRNHPRYMTRMRPNTEATLTSKVPEISKAEVKKPARLIEDKKAISRKRRNRFTKAPSPAEIAKNLLELDKLDFDLTGQSAHPAIEFVNKLGDQIESEELKTIAARYTPNYMVRDGILYRKDNTPIANLRPPNHSARASAADNYQKRKEQRSPGDISPAKLRQLIKDDQTKVSSSNVLLEESNDNYKAILRPGQLQQRINQAVAIPMDHHTITQSNYVKPVEPVIEPKKYQKPHKHKQSYQKLHRQSGLTIREFGPDEIEAAPTMPTRTKYRKMVEFIDDNNIEDITAPTEEVAEEGNDANSNEIWNERKISEMPPPFPFSHCYMNTNGKISLLFL